ncbi:hypothetical protein [Haloferula rosea]|uniref:Uncharacterized protein n=1 Tax=Haloferula rosea TaxID=490093 RepID=A0A934RBE3_9BACT|nr:hypothetical protein [Haloferula rosea]MBK1828569.1 hypothetical protein [Haloferula rosea]
MMNPPHLQALEQAYHVGQLKSVRAGHVRAETASPEVHAVLNRLMWVSVGLLVAALNTVGSVGLWFYGA